ncbi:Oidioi.mRNA.OKI2018_I69.chr2.g7963.t1.cds [Oikopleura dioica]|uniref:Oidioi.mRNA.OKI2018_I69.chr2.g7963.t1.cds n=1 Tax=Oikopleura dioica TaxID=34765 RepID=A0ABN7T7S7_OIKDI|nr:Oidioi.mRNA.OKI2018_I69.chr2.g7963.t1.cds [Oikopleura dioica]
MKTREYDQEGVDMAIFDLLERAGIGKDALVVDKMDKATVNGTHIVVSFIFNEKNCGDIFGGYRHLCAEWIKQLEAHPEFEESHHKCLQLNLRRYDIGGWDGFTYSGQYYKRVYFYPAIPKTGIYIRPF